MVEKEFPCDTCERWKNEMTLEDYIEVQTDPSKAFRDHSHCTLPMTDDGSGRVHGLCNPFKDARYHRKKETRQDFEATKE